MLRHVRQARGPIGVWSEETNTVTHRKVYRLQKIINTN